MYDWDDPFTLVLKKYKPSRTKDFIWLYHGKCTLIHEVMRKYIFSKNPRPNETSPFKFSVITISFWIPSNKIYKKYLCMINHIYGQITSDYTT
jgi:hypothetical protein